MECFKNQTQSSKFTLKGSNLENDVTLTLNDENGVFVLDKTAITPDEDGKVNETVEVTYAPKAEGNYTATVVVSAEGVDDIVINLAGTSEYELYRPIMQDADQAMVTSTSFRADWTDRTPAENVVSYSLEVKLKPDVVLLTEADWSDVPEDDTNHAADATNYLPDGWTFTGNYFYLDGGFVSANRNCSFNPNCDLMGYSTVSVIIKAKAYPKGSNTTITVTTDEAAEDIVLAKELGTYLVVLPVGDHGFVKIITGYYPEIQSIKIYGGEITDPEPFEFRASESGDSEFRLIEGITPDMFYTVTGLTPASPYLYRVKALYVNGTESKWSNTKEVVLKAGENLRGDVDGNGNVTIDDVTALIDVLLTGNATPSADCDNNGRVNIDDVTALINYILLGEWE